MLLAAEIELARKWDKRERVGSLAKGGEWMGYGQRITPTHIWGMREPVLGLS